MLHLSKQALVRTWLQQGADRAVKGALTELQWVLVRLQWASTDCSRAPERLQRDTRIVPKIKLDNMKQQDIKFEVNMKGSKHRGHDRSVWNVPRM